MLATIAVHSRRGAACRLYASDKANERSGGGLYLYLAPLTTDTSRLRFIVDKVEAIADDGNLWPLTLSLTEITFDSVDHQRFFASGQLPAGKYRGLAVTIKGAWVMTEDGEVALLPPEKAVEVPISFTLRKGKAKLLEMAYHHGDSIRNNVLFVPVLTAYVPDQPLVDRAGYACCPESRYLVVFDRLSLQAKAIVAVDDGPVDIAVDQDRQRVYVSVNGADKVDILDLRSGETIGSIILRPGDMPGRIALTPDGLLLLVLNGGSNSVSYIDTNSQIETERLTVGEDPQFVITDRNGQRGYVFNTQSDTISVLDLSQPAVLATIVTENGPIRGDFNQDSSRLYILHHNSPYMSVLDTNSLAIIDRIDVGIGASSLLVDPRSDLIYLGRTDDTRVEIYDPFSKLPVDFLNDAGSPTEMVIDDEENRLLLAEPSPTGILALDLTSRQSAGFVETGSVPSSLDIAGARR